MGGISESLQQAKYLKSPHKTPARSNTSQVLSRKITHTAKSRIPTFLEIRVNSLFR
jgi:hypothetical protein